MVLHPRYRYAQTRTSGGTLAPGGEIRKGTSGCLRRGKPGEPYKKAVATREVTTAFNFFILNRFLHFPL